MPGCYVTTKVTSITDVREKYKQLGLLKQAPKKSIGLIHERLNIGLLDFQAAVRTSNLVLCCEDKSNCH